MRAVSLFPFILGFIATGVHTQSFADLTGQLQGFGQQMSQGANNLNQVAQSLHQAKSNLLGGGQQQGQPQGQPPQTPGQPSQPPNQPPQVPVQPSQPPNQPPQQPSQPLNQPPQVPSQPPQNPQVPGDPLGQPSRDKCFGSIPLALCIQHTWTPLEDGLATAGQIDWGIKKIKSCWQTAQCFVRTDIDPHAQSAVGWCGSRLPPDFRDPELTGCYGSRRVTQCMLNPHIYIHFEIIAHTPEDLLFLCLLSALVKEPIHPWIPPAGYVNPNVIPPNSNLPGP